jgi:gamma-glutamyltranspeptidase/glutathione hydrolase
VEYRHLAAEAIGHAYMDCTLHYGDPDFARSPVNGLASRAFGAARAAGLRLDRAAPRPIAPADPWPYESAADAPERLPFAPTRAPNGGTSQMAAADRQGNLVTLITTLNGNFGSLAYVPEVGIFLNNAMENYSAQPGLPNSIAPGKMPISSGPALVATWEGRAAFGGCGSGGYRIVSGVLQTFIHCVDFGMGAQAAVEAPRVHNHGEATYVDARIPAPVRARLAEMGHEVIARADQPGATHFARVNAIRIDPQTGLLHASAGPAWLTGAAGY